MTSSDRPGGLTELCALIEARPGAAERIAAEVARMNAELAREGSTRRR